MKRSATGEAETFPGRDFGFVDISFTLNGQESSYNIALEISLDAGNVYTAILPEFLSGDLVNIPPGVNKQITWDSPNVGANRCRRECLQYGFDRQPLLDGGKPENNFHAVQNTNGLCPTGWHVPSDTEWTVMTDFLGGIRDYMGYYGEMGVWGRFWSSTEAGYDAAWSRSCIPAIMIALLLSVLTLNAQEIIGYSDFFTFDTRFTDVSGTISNLDNGDPLPGDDPEGLQHYNVYRKKDH